jgi:hypothetical protein
MHFRKKRYIAIILFLTFIVNGSLSYGQQIKNHSFEQQNIIEIAHKKIINQGIEIVFNEKMLKHIDLDFFKQLVNWYDSHLMIEFATLVKTTITLKFIDGSYTVLIDILSLIKNPSEKYGEFYESIDRNLITTFDRSIGQTALILNPSEYLYGNRHCKKIINKLLSKGYNIAYLANEDVDLPYIEYNLGSEIVYINTHAGYWDIDGDSQSDAVVIATGEYWTNETKEIYKFEYENKMIVEGMVGDKSFIAFTPILIEHFYEPGDFPDSLVYMATCHATYDTSMANAFLDLGASAYMGWTRNTVFWTNSLTSVLVFRLLFKGFTVGQVCRIIRHSGIINCLLRSKLTYFGNGKYRLIT